MKLTAILFAASGTSVAHASTGLRDILMEDCKPSTFEGIWTHMMQDPEVPGGGLREVIVTCEKTAESCQIVDANKQVPPDGTVAGGCGFVGTLAPTDMYIDETTGTCAFKPLVLDAAGCSYTDDFPNLSISGTQDHQDLWHLFFETGGELHMDRWTTRNFCRGDTKQASTTLAQTRAVDANQCMPQAFEGVWTHMMQDAELPGGGLREVIVTCPRHEYSDMWGDGSCQIADVNKQAAPDGTPEGGCGFVGIIKPSDMYVSESGDCAFNLVDLSSSGCDFPGLSVAGEQDSDHMWMLSFSLDDGTTMMGPRYSTRQACGSEVQVADELRSETLAESKSSIVSPWSSFVATILTCFTFIMVF